MKIFGKVIIGLLVLIILLVAGAVIYIIRVDPNTYKPQIQDLAKEQFGAIVEIGTIEWQFWPNIGLGLSDLSLATQAKDHSQLLKVGKAGVSVAVMPLLQSQIRIDQVLLDSPKVWIHQYENGQHNWQPLLDKLASQSTEDANQDTSEPAADLDFSVAEVALQKGQVMVSGPTKATINPLNLSIKNLGINTPMDVSMTALIAALDTRLDLALNANLTFDQAAQYLKMDKLETSIKGAEPNQSLKLQATADINLASMAAKAILNVAPIDMDAWLFLTNGQTAQASSKTDQAPSTDKPAPIEIPKAMLQDLDLDLSLKLQQVTYKSAQHKLAMQVMAQKGIVQLSKFALDAYQGQATGDIKLNANTTPAKLDVNLKVDKMKIDNISQTWLGMQPLAGAFSSDINLTAKGDTVDQLIDSLRGQTSLGMANTTLPKINLHDLVWSSLQSKQATLVKALNDYPELKNQMGTLKTPKVLRGTTTLSDFLAKIQLTPEQVKTDSIKASLNGEPVQAQLSYGRLTQIINFSTALKLPFENTDLANIMWPIACKGSLAAKSITDIFNCSVDSSELKPLLKSLAQQQLKSKVKQELAPVEDKARQQLKEAEDKAKDKLEQKAQEKLGTSLKGLFGR